MSKEHITILVASLVGVGLLWKINTEVSNIKAEVGALQDTAQANNKAIAELRSDVSEIRSVVNVKHRESVIGITCKAIDTACKVIGVKW